jgi:hypothetical protein
MIIGKTPLTEELYGEFIADEYHKSYAVNIRNRFSNDGKHIVVKDYEGEELFLVCLIKLRIFAYIKEDGEGRWA